MNPLYLFAGVFVLLAIPSGMKARALRARGRRDLAFFESVRVLLSLVAAVLIVWTIWGRPA